MYGRAQMCSSVTVELRTTAQKVLAEALPVSPQPPGEGVIFPQASFHNTYGNQCAKERLAYKKMAPLPGASPKDSDRRARK